MFAPGCDVSVYIISENIRMSAEKIVRERFSKFHSGGRMVRERTRKSQFISTDSYHLCIMIFVPKHSGRYVLFMDLRWTGGITRVPLCPGYLLSEWRNGESLGER